SGGPRSGSLSATTARSHLRSLGSLVFPTTRPPPTTSLAPSNLPAGNSAQSGWLWFMRPTGPTRMTTKRSDTGSWMPTGPSSRSSPHSAVTNQRSALAAASSKGHPFRASARHYLLMTGERLVGHLLVATPALRDPNFERSVVLVVAHEDSGALGV